MAQHVRVKIQGWSGGESLGPFAQFQMIRQMLFELSPRLAGRLKSIR